MSTRIRSIKPEILQDAVTAGLSDMAFRVFIACIVLSDDYGRFRAEPAWLRSQIYWTHTVTIGEFEDALRELRSLILFYEVNGQRYAEVRNWGKHQKVDRPGKPRIPAPCDDCSRETRDTLATPSRDSRECLDAPSRDSRGTLATDLGSGIRDQGTRISEQIYVEQATELSREAAPPEASPSRAEPREVLFAEEGIESAPESTETPPVSTDDPKALALARNVRLVFEHWVSVRTDAVPGARATKLTPDRRRRISARLRDGFTVADLCRAVDGMFSTAFNVEKGFTDIELCCRSAQQVERFMANADLAEQLSAGGAA